MEARRAVSFLALFLLAAPVQAAVVYLKDGGTITGTVVSSTPSELEITTDGQTVRIGMDRISRVDDQAPAPAPSWRPRPEPRPRFDGRPRDSLSFELGAAVPVSGVNLDPAAGSPVGNGDAGALIGFQYLHALDERWSAGVDFDYFHRSGAPSSNLVPGTDDVVFGDDVVLLGLAKYSLVSDGWVRPYVAAGLGVADNSLTIDAAPQPGFAWSDTGTAEPRRLVDGDAWTWASSLRFGIDFPGYWLTTFALEFGWTHLGSVHYPATAQGQSLGLSGASGGVDAITVAGRWGWRF